MKNLNGMVKSFKSMKFIKTINGGLLKLGKSLNIKPTQMYVILGLLALLLVTLALNLGKKKEGFMSMSEANASKLKAMDDMRKAINSVTWNPLSQKSIFSTNVVDFYSKKLMFLNQGDLSMNAVDLGGPAGATVPDKQVYKLKAEFDISGNTLPRYRDNTSVTVANSNFDIKKYDITQIVLQPVNQSELDALSKTIRDRIALYAPYEQKTLTDAFNALSRNADEVYKYISSPSSGGGVARDLGDGGYGESRAERLYRLSLISSGYKYDPLD